MSAVPDSSISYAEYLSHEQNAVFKSEFYQGKLYAMVGGSPRHNSISVNLVAILRNRLRGSNCRPFNSDQRIRIPANGLATYPDVSVICGEPEIDHQDQDAIGNPVILFEVLSKSTESYDRGKKFDLYRQLDSLKEYILVAQDEAHVERFERQDDGSWLLSIAKGTDQKISLSSVASEILLSEIYEDIQFDSHQES